MPLTGSAPTILVADDDRVSRRIIETSLKAAGLYAASFESGDALLKAFTDDAHVCVLDLNMTGTDGRGALMEIKRRHPRTEVIFLTAVNDAREAVEALRAGAFDYLTKPFDPAELVRSVRKAMALALAARNNDEIRASISNAGPAVDLLGESEAMVAIKALLERIGPTEETVLLTGESGTGKTILARAVHAASKRREGPFLSVSCPSLPRELLESEMFGHEKGAFSGAHQKRLGRAELASGGTLFLDEVGELPLELQPKLLTFLQDHTFFRIGGQRALRADVRVVAATNQDLPRLCREGRFREDLFYRLNVVPLELPPLRVRRGDIVLLAERFLRSFSQRNATRPVVLSPQAVDALRGYAWPGNVRELENVLSRVATLSGANGRIERGDLPPAVLGEAAPNLAPSASAARVGFFFAGKSLDQIEKAALLDALDRHCQNRIQTAKALGVSEKTIYNMMRRHGLMSSGTRAPME